MNASLIHALGLAALSGIEMALFTIQLPDRVPITIPQTAATLPVVPVREDLVMAVQIELSLRGFAPGPVDGIAGPRTRAAIRAYRRWMGEPDDDQVSEALRSSLMQVP